MARNLLSLITRCLFILSMAGCARDYVPNPVSTVETTASALPVQPTASMEIVLATPYALIPAAGICALADSQLAEVQITTGMPEPRCIEVLSDQILVLTNRTGEAVDVRLGDFAATIQAGHSMQMDKPVGQVLEPGAHRIEMESCCSPEIWLK